MLRNRRISERQEAGDLQSTVSINSVVAEGIVLDLSPEGARIGGIRVSLLFADQLVYVQTPHEGFAARCRTVYRDDNGTFQIGLMRVADVTDTAPSPTVLINSFVKQNGQETVCLPIAMVDGAIQVQLLSGQMITVPEHQVIQHTRSERLEELCDDQRLAAALQAYGQESTENNFVDRTTVLNHEFGPPNLSLITH